MANSEHESNKEGQSEQFQIPGKLPLVLVDDAVIFPGIVTPIAVTEQSQVNLFNEVLGSDNRALVMALKKPGGEGKPRLDEPYPIAGATVILKMLRIPDGTLRLLLQGLARVQIDKIIVGKNGHREVEITPLQPKPAEGQQVEALTRLLREEFSQVIDLSQYLPNEMKVALLNITDISALADFITSNLNIKPDDRQEILATLDLEERLTKVSKLVSRELELIKLGSKIQTEVSGSIEKSQREYFLREQLKAIRRELGEEEEGGIEIKELKERTEKLVAPDKVKEAATKELERLTRMNPASSEYTVSRSYIDWLLEIPWSVATKDQLDIPEARSILDHDHYGLDDVKERILEYLAVRKLKGEGRGSILCFVGPPGVGKTSIGKSIATAMGRKFVRMSLGGLRDEAEIRGHRRTYIGALPGRIIQNIKRAGSNNPVFMLDEIDKLGTDFRGDPASAMLEVLDPEQNFSFNDNYIELDFDLSRVMFITTANYLETIPPPLRDRMEIIKLPGYITPEKVQIARRHLVPRQITENGLTSERIKFTDRALENLIIFHTREAGVRTLERTIGTICRKVAVKVTSAKRHKRYLITVKNLEKFLGSPKVMPDLFNRRPVVGVANGLAWTAFGGTLLLIEAIMMPGDGKMKVTGQLGDVMKESVEIALSYIRSRAAKLKIPADAFKKNDVHIHFPEGATPKDGPSAGITITTALASLFTGRLVRHDIAMTGEITLEGRVLPIGGLREKSVAAARAHMKMIVCPADNRGDLEEIPDIIKEKLEFKFVETLDDVLKVTLLPNGK
jgi:ATP-dependent Lon protease